MNFRYIITFISLKILFAKNNELLKNRDVLSNINDYHITLFDDYLLLRKNFKIYIINQLNVDQLNIIYDKL